MMHFVRKKTTLGVLTGFAYFASAHGPLLAVIVRTVTD
jgi:hypothetical protein